MRAKNAALLDRLFRLGVLCKVVDGAAQLVGGALYWRSPPGLLSRWVRLLTHDELSEEPRDYLATHLRAWAAHLGHHGHVLLTAYLLLHGLIQVFLGIALLRDRLWAYPWAAFFLTTFAGYLVYGLTLRFSPASAVLCLLDLGTIALLAWEYRRHFRPVSRRPHAAKFVAAVSGRLS
ncbi:MAG: DUF2127 domain-containing protein [Elusimicrobia bacterium]|nr:DUF2127 domain-containing protein [Elusimicrobiota bacterium]